MPDYVQITFNDLQPEQQDVLIAHLSDAGYEGFEQIDHQLKAFIHEKGFDKRLLQEFAYKYQLEFTTEKIPEQNWNAIWEAGFDPVIVENFAIIRADFHSPVPGIKHDIIITPKMSFGTGHHATTWMMMEVMRTLEFSGKTVFDFGTGTGILSILAEKLGAKKITAIDNDDWSIDNAAENISKNNCRSVQLIKGETVVPGPYDIILANINKNIILDHFSSLVDQVGMNGFIVLSGLLETDEEDILLKASEFSLNGCGKLSKNNWICLVFNR